MFLDLSGNLYLIFTYHHELNIVHFHYKIILSHWHMLRRAVCHKMRPVTVTCIGTRCTYQMDMRLPIPGKYFGCSSEFSICITTTINQGNSSVAPVLLKFVNDVFAKLKILHDYVTGENPRSCFAYLRHFLDSTKERQAVLLEHVCVHVLFWSVLLMCTVHGHTCVHGWLSHLCARFNVTLMWTVDCHIYVHGWLSHLCARFTVTLMCTVHCHTYVYGWLSHLCARLTVTLMCTVDCHTLEKYLSSKCHNMRKSHAP